MPRLGTLVVLSLLSLLVLRTAAGEPTREGADALFEAKNYAEAAREYAALLDGGDLDETVHHAARRLVVCRMRLGLFDEALDAADRYVELCRGTPHEPRAERLAGNLWLSVPHWGTRAGGTFHRAQHRQGIRLQSYGHDKRKALEHLRRARELYADYDRPERAADLAVLPAKERAGWHAERIGCLFDLAGVHARFGIYERDAFFWTALWGERDDATAGTAGVDDFEEYHSRWALRRTRPVGLRVDADGRPVFPTAARAYDPALGDDESLLFLLGEIRRLDRSEDRFQAALATYRQAMLARTRFGVERARRASTAYHPGRRRALEDELEGFRTWEIDDDESLVLAGGRIRRVTLPDRWNAMALLGEVVEEHGETDLAPAARYAAALIHQTRQQYATALEEYASLREDFPDSEWADRAGTQTERIRAPAVALGDTGVQHPSAPAVLSLTHRNLEKVWFTARPIDVEAFLREIRDQEIDPDKGLPHLWNLGNWSSVFVRRHGGGNPLYDMAAKHLGEEAYRWAEPVVDDGTHRAARRELASVLDGPGAWLVQAYVEEPPAEDAPRSGREAMGLGESRTVVVLTDLALVEKKTAEGKLYLVTDALSGAPVRGAEVEVLEVWTTWDRKLDKDEHHKAIRRMRTDEDGLVQLPRRHRGGQLHALVTAGAGEERRVAWSGMSWWRSHHPSIRDRAHLAYVVTDRPVYRPGQRVRYKVWQRRMRDGVYIEDRPRRSGVVVYDPRGTSVHEARADADEFGGFDGEFVLGDEPRLGLYRIRVSGSSYAGGATFRVEEYRKPEFEVSVEPGATHAKLGRSLRARIRADYYFGGPVAGAEVRYRVFREEYRHAIYPPGRWDWLYGAGYGYAWYDHPWFGWWGHVLGCRVAPSWWWHWTGVSGWAPVRELVSEGEGMLGEDGTLTVDIDTAPALRDHPDRDHRYVIEAEVRDASRRVVKGEGAVVVTRQAYFAAVLPRRGWNRPGDEIPVTIRCLTPENTPVAASGIVTVSEISYGGPDNTVIRETELDRFRAECDERGAFELNLRHERSGLLRIGFEAPDAWSGTVRGDALVWVVGDDFDGRFHRFNDLELVTDKRTYRPGEVAHVMVSTARAGSHVLFADDVDNGSLLSWRMLRIPGRSTVVDVPVERGGAPAFFVEAVTVSDGRVHSQIRRICVPPEDALLDVTVRTDRAEYGPGDEAEVEVTALGPDGEPVRAQVAVTAFDRSLLYIQEELTPSPARFFHGHEREHRLESSTNLTERFRNSGDDRPPSRRVRPAPPAWWGTWGPTVASWPTFSDREILDMVGEERLGDRRRDLETAARSGATDAPPPSAGASYRQVGVGGGAGGAFAGDSAGSAHEEGALVEAEVRRRFADTACWAPSLVTGADGKARTTFVVPENLTTWKVAARAITKGTHVGEAETSVVSTKNLIVRLQAPRFFLETDEVMLTANVHNFLAEAKTARVSLEVPEDLLERIGDTPESVDVEVAAGGEARVDWRVRVRKEGVARILVKALTDEESDAMERTFPVLVHGMTKQVSTTGSMRTDDDGRTITVELDVPEKRRPELTRLEIRYTPTLAGAMLDALPYCLNYPYGCTEQTMSRFLPAVLTLKTLRDFGIRLEDVSEIRRGRMEEIRRIEEGEGIALWSTYADSAIFDDDALADLIGRSLRRLATMQNGDGGWGWWSRNDSNAYLTSYVLFGLTSAREAGVEIDRGMLSRGKRWLEATEEGHLRDERWRVSAGHAFAAYVLSRSKARATIEPAEGDERPGDGVERLWRGRDELNLYGKALLALTLANLEDVRAPEVLRNIVQYAVVNEETQSAHFRTPSAGWWYWWNSDIETNAWILRALVRIEPKGELAPKVVRWLLENRRGGYYWRSTRDTTLCVAAMGTFVRATGEAKPDYTLRIDLDDGAVVKEVRVTPENFFTFDNRFVVEGATLTGGRHRVKITKTGPGALYFNTDLRYFTKEDHIGAAGHELKVARRYFRLEQVPYEVEVDGADGQPVRERRLRYERVPVRSGDTVKSGDVIQVELELTADNSYTYLAFEDMKPAGFEPVELRSGRTWQEGFVANMELRDEKVAFFVGRLDEGSHLIRYRLRAEIPGSFHALPARVFAMYAPRLRANAEECLIRIVD